MSGTDGATDTIATAGTATGTAATTTTAAAGTTTTDAGTAAQGAGAATQAAPTVEQLQADVEKWKALSRKNEQAAKAKTETDAAQKKLLAEVAQKLGIATTDGTPDPAAITAQLEAAQRDAKTRSTELAVLRAASRLGADGDALLDSRAFVAQLEGLETPEAIEAAIKLAVAQSPAKYATRAQGAAAATGPAASNSAVAAATTASASSAGDFTGAAGGNRQWTQADVDAAKPEQVVKAMEQGLLKALLGG
jgi:hypothetical protein